MNWRRLVFGLSALCVVVGLLLASFTPGGFLVRPAEQAVQMDLPVVGQMRIESQSPGPWDPGPVAGYALMALGAAGLVVAWAMKPSTARKPERLSY